MGRIIALNQAPRCKFVFPKNGDESLVENAPFTVQMKILSMETGKFDVATEPHRTLTIFIGNFVNAQTNYYAAPQQVNDQGLLIGHSHIVIETLSSLQDTEPLDPTQFAFFKGLNNPVDGNNILSANLTSGLPAGVYRMCSINTAANHQPALVSNAQHGALDDCSYFTVKAAGANSNATASSSTTGSTDAAQSTDSASSSTDTATDTSTTTGSVNAAQATDSTSSSTDTATDASTTTGSVDAAQATDSASSSTDTATDASTTSTTTGSVDAAQATDSASSSTDTATDAPAATESQGTSSGAPVPTHGGRNKHSSS
jgi:hypothetical protein